MENSFTELEEETENITTFPEAWKEEFEGLLFLGYLQKEVTQVPFHKFIVKTLTINEKIEVSLLTKPYVDSVGFNRAWKAAVVAAGLVSVDDRPLIASSKNVNSLKQKFDYVTQNWYDIVVEILYEEIQRLEDDVVIVLGELGVINSVIPESIFLDEETSDTPKDGSTILT
jgi:hypothetical protein